LSGSAAAAPSPDELRRRLLELEDRRQEIAALLQTPGLNDASVLALLRRALPAHVLDVLAETAPWGQRTRLQGAIALNPGCSRALAQKLLPGLLWSDLATLAMNPATHSPVKVRAEALLVERLIELRLGERMTLARRATTRVLRPLLEDEERQVVRAALLNPRLREEDLLAALRAPRASLALFSEIPVCFRWKASYAVRRALVLHPRTPLPLALGQVTGLTPADQRRLDRTEGLHPLLRAAARRALGKA
jgi:hypothetical protein